MYSLFLVKKLRILQETIVTSAVLNNTRFINNVADIGGGYSFEGLLPTHINTYANGNIARRGSDFGDDSSSGCPYGTFINILINI